MAKADIYSATISARFRNTRTLPGVVRFLTTSTSLKSKPLLSLSLTLLLSTFFTGSAMAAEAVRPFSINISDQDVNDLKDRLARTRFPDQLNGVSWEYGMDAEYLKELVEYWRYDFDWREQEKLLNSFDQFKTEVDGLDMHFIHQRSENEDAIPLMMVHGWPGSVAEFTKIINPLTNPEQHGGTANDAFHIIAPSLPGFGFSDLPSEPGYNPEKIGHILVGIMDNLGYDKFAIAGGDWGAIINRHIANHYPERLIGLHSNMILASRPQDEELRNGVTDEESQARAARGAYMANEVAYQQIQGTKPQSLGVGLNDSPAGLAAWIVEKFHGWSDLPQDASGDLDNNFSKDELLTNVSIYWFTQTITASTRIYYENGKVPATKTMEYIDVPTGAAIYPKEIFITPRSWVEGSYDLRHWSVMDQGGHFAALEQPESYLQDLRKFFSLLR